MFSPHMQHAAPIPLSIYIHYPWCEKKCPYCDFNSYDSSKTITHYIDALLKDSETQALGVTREISSIFIGGGTPSLMPLDDMNRLFNALHKHYKFKDDCEITIEVNPSSASKEKFREYKNLGINRVSLGIQSFSESYLHFLGRVHSEHDARNAITYAKESFDNINLDIIFGLENQRPSEVMSDVESALSYAPTHMSFYQLTIEPNTYFAKYPPILPDDETLYTMMNEGVKCIEDKGLDRYEVSAYGLASKHNMNYWEFGDYIGLGAGAHGKLTTSDDIVRTTHIKSPADYTHSPKVSTHQIQNKAFDFMLNALRLKEGIHEQLFILRTGLPLRHIEHILQEAQYKELITRENGKIQPTELGYNHLNSLQELFL